MRSVMVVALALFMSACATTLQRTTTVEHYAVQGVHIVIGTEEDAYTSGLISTTQHQKDKQILTEVVQSERALNDALSAWNATGNAGPMPQEVTVAVRGLSRVLADLQPLVVNDNSLAQLVNQLANVIAALTGGGN